MEAEVRRIEQKYSRYRPDSVLSEINQRAGQLLEVDAETSALLGYGRECFQQSEGLFDLSSGVLRRAWNFKKAQIPDDHTLKPLLARIGYGRLQVEGHCLQMPRDMELDLGGIGKEYAADAAATIARRFGAQWGMVDLGGDLHILGPQPDGSPWQLGVRHPRLPGEAIASLPVYQGGMATSGDYERYFERDGRRYSHILNPHSGHPVQHWASVTVIAPTCLLAGTLSTIAVLKEAAGDAWLSEQNVSALLIRPDLTLTTLSPEAEF